MRLDNGYTGWDGYAVIEQPDDDTLAEQVEITVLHELGHFFELDEDDVAELGLA